ncbi:MAG: sulfate permease [Cellulomonadaceae bacterium]
MVWYVSFWIVGTTQRLLWRYAPTNWIVAFVRTRRGHKWGVPIAVLLVPAYTWVCLRVGEWFEESDSVWLALLTGLMFWNAVKLTGLAIASIGLLVRARFRERLA